MASILGVLVAAGRRMLSSTPLSFSTGSRHLYHIAFLWVGWSHVLCILVDNCQKSRCSDRTYTDVVELVEECRYCRLSMVDRTIIQIRNMIDEYQRTIKSIR